MESVKHYIQQMLTLHKTLLTAFEADCLGAVESAAGLLTDCLRGGGCIYLCGNGGSAADAQHAAAELVGRFAQQRKGLPAVALTTDTSILTSVGNDYGFEQIFSRQVEALVHPGDVLWAFSTSGSSPNILAAAALARQKGARVLAFTGRKHSPLEALADVCICVEGPTAAVQEIHQTAYHILCGLAEKALA
ncbi:MAG TPA: SIS domain-containing protein [Anaerohalosphaeraceae bacterium]|nr:SIS domain-containing protein [Phycisphaerae bacterium]HOK95629.1 SIS domain-containing protein [Anaerohalosphaeraceae bacterium]HOL31830.1 SIS domain-containing protein [Anaerohalosphaeraceae bacterium]HOM77001.1 SIS domain-containing protein [Anaerohalosphaeraceae bacterium]HPC65147.1 SIS domain-containing protein [Anaerohalosphaeraceae bacterium]